MANSLVQSPRGAENLERAIAGYEAALEVQTRQAMPVDWARTQMNLVPSPLQQRKGHLIQNSLSYVLPTEDEGYSSLFITVCGLN